MNNQPQFISAARLRAPVLPGIPDRIRRLINAAYAAHRGVEHMTLDDWRDLEQRLKKKLESEHHEAPK